VANPFGTPVRFIPDDTYGGGEAGPASPGFYGPDYYDGNLYIAHGDNDCTVEPVDDLCGVRNLWKSTDDGATFIRSTNMYDTSTILWNQSGSDANPHAIVSGVYYIFDYKGTDLRVSKWDIDAGSGSADYVTDSDLYHINQPPPKKTVGQRINWRFAVTRGTDIYLFLSARFDGNGWPKLNYVVFDTTTDTFGTLQELSSYSDSGSYVVSAALDTSDNSIHIVFLRSDHVDDTAIEHLYHTSLSSGDAQSAITIIDAEKVHRTGSTIYSGVNSMLQVGQVGGVQTLALSYQSATLNPTVINAEEDPIYHWTWYYERVAFSQDSGATWTVENLGFDEGGEDQFRWGPMTITNHYGNPGRGIAIYNDTIYAFTPGMRDNVDRNGIITDDDYTSRLFVHERLGADSWEMATLYTEDDNWQLHSVHFGTDGTSAGVTFMSSGLDAGLGAGSQGYRSYFALFTVVEEENGEEGPADCPVVTAPGLTVATEIDDEPYEKNVRLSN
jgi:hypothetical protein